MKIRILSDLHLDINKDYNLDLHKNGANDVFTLIAGDICGDPRKTIEWIKKNVHQGGFCCGNHLVYNDRKMAIEDLKNELHEAFPLNSNITFFDNDVGVISKEIDDGILLVSDVLYTDYKLKINGFNERGSTRVNMMAAEPKFSGSYMNDFVWGYTKKKMYKKEPWSKDYEPENLWHLRTKYYKNHFDKAFKKITEIIETNQDKQIILMSHHCLSENCISDEFTHDSLNGSYVSPKDKWIMDHPNIKLVISGHVHFRTSFNVGNTLYVLNPLGYCRDTYKQYNQKTDKWDVWTPNCFVDTDTWKLTYEDWDHKEWDDTYDEYNKKFLKYSRAFI